MFAKKGRILAAFIVLMLLIDQAIKIAVKLNMTLGESIHVCGNWFQILFIENRGMAFGMEISSAFWGKLLLSLMRLILIALLSWYLTKLVKRDASGEKVPNGVLYCLALILVGAIGNVLDCLFYGVFFSESTPFAVAQFLPQGGGYAPMLMGRVVDMFYFPIIDMDLPSWFPIWGGEHFVFFRPIFNFADACVSVSVVWLLLFHRKFFR